MVELMTREEYVPTHVPDTCPCEFCKKKKGQKSKVATGDILSYSAIPTGGWKGRKRARERVALPLLGVELETNVDFAPQGEYPNAFPEHEPRWLGAPRPTRPYFIFVEPEPTLRIPYPTLGPDGVLSMTYNEYFEAEAAWGRDVYDPWSQRREYASIEFNRRWEEDIYQPWIAGYSKWIDEMLDPWQERQRAWIVAEEARIAPLRGLTPSEAVSLAAPDDFWLACSDSSVSGPEFKSQPATMAYWRRIKPRVEEMFTGLLHGGVRSHEGDTCGMHINISTDTFRRAHNGRLRDSGEMAEHLERFAKLVTTNPRWATRMAQRTESSASEWSPFEPLDSVSSRQRWAREIALYGYSGETGKYSVLNGGHEGRIEFRLPRGTLRLDRFYAKLEWTASMIEYTRTDDNEITVAAYLGWVKRHKTSWPMLEAYVVERFGQYL